MAVAERAPNHIANPVGRNNAPRMIIKHTIVEYNGEELNTTSEKVTITDWEPTERVY